MGRETLQELFDFDLWGNEKVLTCAAGLGDAQLDRPFEMGLGSLRKTVQHIYGAARNWYERWKGPGSDTLPAAQTLSALADFEAAGRKLHELRTAWLAGLSEAELAKPATYTNWRGETATNVLRDMMLHVANHGVYHRAQGVNMLRRMGAPVPKPGPDYIFKKLEESGRPAPKLDVVTIKEFFAYADWARDRIHDAAAKLSDVHLDKEFEMGMGTLRKTLWHIYAAEQWWQNNWVGQHEPFSLVKPAVTVAEVRRLFAEAAARRNEYVAKQSQADLSRIVEGRPRPDVVRSFPMGCTMLQLCCHGTHHRAQAVNMLRHVGVQPPALDAIIWADERK